MSDQIDMQTVWMIQFYERLKKRRKKPVKIHLPKKIKGRPNKKNSLLGVDRRLIDSSDPESARLREERILAYQNRASERKPIFEGDQ